MTRLPVRFVGGILCLALGWGLVAAEAAPADRPASWQQIIVEDLQRSEYHFRSSQAEDAWSAANRRQGVRIAITEEGLHLAPRASTSDPWEFRLRLVGVSRGDELVEPGTPSISAEGERIELIGERLTEWFVNRPEGLEQGFTLPAPPVEGSRELPLVMEMQTGGGLTAALSPDGSEAVFRTESGYRAVRYAGLVVRDATGAELHSHLEIGQDRLRIVVDDGAATYPVEIDPLVTVPDWLVQSNQTEAFMGVSVASAGDVNGDGYDDVIVGAEDYFIGEDDEGWAFVYLGSASGLATTPDWTAQANLEDARFGVAVASAGDVNGDGYDDVIIGAPDYDSGGETREGSAFVYHGSMAGLGDDGTPLNADWYAEGDQDVSGFGRSVASAGDVNNDGYDDVIIGANLYDNPQTNEGAAFVFHGSEFGLKFGVPGNPVNADWEADSGDVNSRYGSAVASAGDIDGDGYDDVLVGARNYEDDFDAEGRVFLYRGGPGGVEDNPTWFLDGGKDTARLGVSVSSAGDVNNDGYDDVLIGADTFTNGELFEGAAFVFHGLSSGLLGSTPAWVGQIDQGSAFFGFSVASAGDVNNDGYDDVLIGADGFDDGELDEGGAFVYYGSAGGLSDTPARFAEIDQEDARFGSSVACGGDVNNDGYADVLVGAALFTQLEDQEGGAFLFLGCDDVDRDGVCLAVDNCPVVANPEQEDTDSDLIGNACDPCEDGDLDGVCDAPLVLIESSGPGEEVLVEHGSPMRYLANSSSLDPGFGLDWITDFYDDDNLPWMDGNYGAGFEDPPEGAPGGVDDLLQTIVPVGSVSIYTRAEFFIANKDDVETVFLGVDYDDGYVAWVNGTEVFRSGEMPTGTPEFNSVPLSHESSNAATPNYGTLHNVTATGKPVLKNGLNVLALGVWNVGPSSSDLVVVPRLSINRPAETTMSYLANNVEPVGIGDWTLFLGFDDSEWPRGNYGVGYEAGTGAEDLIATEIPTDSLSIFTRATFNVKPSTVDSFFLGADYDDGYVAWINGVEVHRSPEMPGNPDDPVAWDADPSAHESSNGAEPDYSPLIDITVKGGNALFEGENMLAIGAWRNSGSTDDLVLVPRLSVNEGNVDNCIGFFNPDQEDMDMDGQGDPCDEDIDGDGFDNPEDNCPLIDNAGQEDFDVDMIGDVCDSCPDDANNDQDNDGICEGSGFQSPKVGDGDNCPDVPNPPSDCDNNSGTPDEQCDLDMDGEGDACDMDIDGDGFFNGNDNCPLEDNPSQIDVDMDGHGVPCDCDDDDLDVWEEPLPATDLLFARTDVCYDFACTEGLNACVDDTDCVSDICIDMECTISLLPCGSDDDCEKDTCDTFLCRHGGNECSDDSVCTADVCTGKTCTVGGNDCSDDSACVLDFCDNVRCTIEGNFCNGHEDCDPNNPFDFCAGTCAVSNNICLDDTPCDADFCQGNCMFGSNPLCLDDSDCTDDVCEGLCTVGGNTCTDDSFCTASQVDICQGDCTITPGTCFGDNDCMAPQTDECKGSCYLSGTTCEDDTPCGDPPADMLKWKAPLSFGATSGFYDTLRSDSPSNFIVATSCIDTDGTDTITQDGATPGVGGVFHYLIRTENDCPGGIGNMGEESDGTDRTGTTCP